ncbi:MAG TPA: ArsR family transcriptional regulator [Thermodesulfatator atlanticus]|uniref:ArsR family transcriptional regulator n=1 Tax=Thermodesulfatator atlanticus TaxID=501497 RepID=A0A7V5P0Z5_9BACT|nr:ArsR family transcriptional regulator [Thermodesulfatator atlanticus]
MKILEKRLKALADATRLKLLALLAHRPCCVCELAEVIGFSQPTISRHLKLLVDAGFVEVKKRGSFQIYRLSPEDDEAAALLELVLSRLRLSPEFLLLKEALSRADKRHLWEGKK